MLSVLLDLAVTCRPMRLLHCGHPVLLGLGYLAFRYLPGTSHHTVLPGSVIYWSLGGTDPYGDPWIYPMLDWGQAPGAAALTVLGFAAGTVRYLDHGNLADDRVGGDPPTADWGHQGEAGGGQGVGEEGET